MLLVLTYSLFDILLLLNDSVSREIMLHICEQIMLHICEQLLLNDSVSRGNHVAYLWAGVLFLDLLFDICLNSKNEADELSCHMCCVPYCRATSFYLWFAPVNWIFWLSFFSTLTVCFACKNNPSDCFTAVDLNVEEPLERVKNMSINNLLLVLIIMV